MFYSYDDNFFNNLNKPKIQPPKWIFKYVWSLLFILMGISFVIIIFQKNSLTKYVAVIIFFIQLLLNLYWTKVFFIEHNLKKAFSIVISLTIIVLIMILYFFNISILAGAIQIPYLLWLIFACILNKMIINLNT